MKDLVKRRKSEVRYCKRLSNGQLLNIYFWRNKEHFNFGWMNSWKVGLIICENRKQANRWFNRLASKEDNASTGNCGLEGLRLAQDIILNFRDNMGVDDILLVSFSNRKRAMAYRRLVKHGFEEYFLENEFKAYGALNPKYWVKVET